MSLFTVIWKAISPHHHSRTNGQSKWPFSFTTSGPLHHHCFIPLINRQVDQWCKIIPSSTAKLINLIISYQDDSMVRTISSSTVLNMMIIIDHQWLNNIPSPASMTKAIPACCYQKWIFYTDISRNIIGCISAMPIVDTLVTARMKKNSTRHQQGMRSKFQAICPKKT